MPPRFVSVEVFDGGSAIGVLLRESDGTISAIRIPIEELADQPAPCFNVAETWNPPPGIGR